jgi:hypothetical protein
MLHLYSHPCAGRRHRPLRPAPHEHMLRQSARGLSPSPAAAQSSRKRVRARKEVARRILERRRGREVTGLGRRQGGKSPDLEGRAGKGARSVVFPPKTQTGGGAGQCSAIRWGEAPNRGKLLAGRLNVVRYSRLFPFPIR